MITDDGRAVEPGSGEIGRVAVGGFQPVGYYKDDEKSAATFITFEGKRYSVPGDYATVEADGSLTLLGRGSVCINTGGEKVFPEEVEEVLKTHESVADAVAVGVPDEKFGEAITAVVELEPGAGLDEAAVIAHVKGKLAAYKAPKRVLPIDTIGRAPNGKVDYKRLKGWAADELGVTAVNRAAAGAPRRVPPRARHHRPEGRAAVRAGVGGGGRRQRGAARPTTPTPWPRSGAARPPSTSSWSSIEADIERLLLLQAPVAGELRYALAIIRIVPELERSGDLAEHIAKRAGSGWPPSSPPPPAGMLERMGTVTRGPLARGRRWLRRPRPHRRRAPRGRRRRGRRPPHRPHRRAAQRGSTRRGGRRRHPRRPVLRAPRRPRRPHRHPGGPRRRLTTGSARAGQTVAMATALRNSNPALNDKAFAAASAETDAGWAAGTQTARGRLRRPRRRGPSSAPTP